MGKGKKNAKLWLTNKEWKEEWGGFKDNSRDLPFQKLPFDHCALTFEEFDTGSDPVATGDGTCFNSESLRKYLDRFGVHPRTGEKLATPSLIQLKFIRDEEGKVVDPISKKPFTWAHKVVTIRTSGNVYSYETIDTMNIKVKNWTDLLDSVEFTRKDIVVIQDPNDLKKHNWSEFYHVKQRQNVRTCATKEEDDELKRRIAEEREKLRGERKVMYSTHPQGDERHKLTEDQLNERVWAKARVSGKLAYASLSTSEGDMNFELFVTTAPKTCDNFIRLCEEGYYNGTRFHRLIKNFMIQGGRPLDGTEGRSGFKDGEPFDAEINKRHKFKMGGWLAMANTGEPKSDASQFFITFKSCEHLNTKHTIFGKLVGGMEVLKELEKLPTIEDDVPKEPITLVTATVKATPFPNFVEEVKDDHWKEVHPREARKRDALREAEAAREAQLAETGPVTPSWVSAISGKAPIEFASGEPSAKKQKTTGPDLFIPDTVPAPAPAKPMRRKMDFSGW